MFLMQFKVIELVEQDIKYKTDADTLDYKYTHAGSGKTTIKTIYWNSGRPSFECEGKPCYGTSYRREDIWHLNCGSSRAFLLVASGREMDCESRERRNDKFVALPEGDYRI